MSSSSRKKAKKRATDSKDRDSSSSSSSGPGIVNSDLPFLPDDSIEEIVSRLPIKDVIRFGCVSKTALHLISDPDFIHKHMKICCHSVPMIVVLSSHGIPRCLLDKWLGSKSKRAKILKKCHLHPEYRLLLSSQDGLMVSTKEYRYICAKDYIIFNPIYSETVEITLTSTDTKCYDGSRMSKEMLGVFYRPCVKEYSTLWEFTAECRDSRTAQYSYEVLDLCSQSKWRKIEYPFCRYQRFWFSERVLINGFIYWVCKADEHKYGIMVFDTSIEGFELLPCPDTATPAFNEGRHNMISLLNGNGVLKLVQISGKKIDFEVNIWALNDRVKNIWSSSQYRIISGIGNSSSRLFKSAQIIALWNDELVLVVAEDDKRHTGTFVCNLKLGTTRKFGRRYECVSFTSHVMSLAPIKSCKLKLAI